MSEATVIAKAYALHQALCDHFGDRMPTPIDDHATELLTALDEYTASRGQKLDGEPVNCVGEPMTKASNDPYYVHGCLDPDTWPDMSVGNADMNDVFDGRR